MTAARLSPGMRQAVLALHVAALLGGVVYAGVTVSQVRLAQAAVDQAGAAMQELDARLKAGAVPPGAPGAPPADPFLAGTSASIASANLQQRVVAAIREAGGTVTSSQVEAGEAEAASGAAPGANGPMVSLTVTCQLADTGLQTLLYDLEAHAPTVFVDQLTIEASAEARGAGAGGGGGEALKISLTVSAYWKAGGRS